MMLHGVITEGSRGGCRVSSKGPMRVLGVVEVTSPGERGVGCLPTRRLVYQAAVRLNGLVSFILNHFRTKRPGSRTGFSTPTRITQ